MRKLFHAFLVSLMMLYLGVTIALADGMILPETFSTDYLVVRYHHVTVSIEDNHAVTRVEQEFFNPYSTQVSGRYIFPIPPDAVLSNFNATVDGITQVVTRQNQAVTKTMLFEMVAEHQDPSLLQYVDWESLAFEITLPPGGSRQMSLEYEELLAPIGGLYHYRYILSTERYSSQPLEKASIKVSISSSEGLSTLYSSSHNVAIENKNNGQAYITWEAENIHPKENFDLFFAPSDGEFGGGFLTGEQSGSNHFLFLFAPEINLDAENVVPKDIVFVIDRSGSMDGEKMEQAKSSLKYMLNQLNQGDRFSIVAFDDQISIFSSTLLSSNTQNLSRARLFVNNLYANNATDIETALQTGLDILESSEPRSSASKMMIFLTDGLPTSGITDERSITRLVSQTNENIEARLHVFGVGYDVNTHLLDNLANENRGSVTYVQPGENLEAVLVSFFGSIANPVLTDVEVEFDGILTRDIFPKDFPDMFQGSSLMLTGRFLALGPNVTLRVRGKTGDRVREYEYHYNLDETAGSDFVPRLWATRQIGALLDIIRVEGESDQLVEEIRELGLSYGLVTPYTTFVIAPQQVGAASQENMLLYNNPTQLNQVSGSTTIQARVQNQFYQQSDQANLAVGANVVNIKQNSLAKITNQNVDLSLLKGQDIQNVPITEEWLEENIIAERYVEFGSVEYFELAKDQEIRSFLQSGPNVLFSYNGEIISIQTADGLNYDQPSVDGEIISVQTEDELNYDQPPTFWSFIEDILEFVFSFFRGW